jgi:hypothetical protein
LSAEPSLLSSFASIFPDFFRFLPVHFPAVLVVLDKGSNHRDETSGDTWTMGKKQEPGRQADGVYFRNIGAEPDGRGGFKVHKFRFGRDRGEARLRALQLERCWDAIVRSTPPGKRAVWDETTLQIGQAIAHGEDVVRFTPPPLTHFDNGESIPEWLLPAIPMTRIRQLRHQGYTLRKIGEIWGLPPETARRYCKGVPAGNQEKTES